MKITDTTPKPVERKFTLVMSERELHAIHLGLGCANRTEVAAWGASLGKDISYQEVRDIFHYITDELKGAAK